MCACAAFKIQIFDFQSGDFVVLANLCPKFTKDEACWGKQDLKAVDDLLNGSSKYAPPRRPVPLSIPCTLGIPNGLPVPAVVAPRSGCPACPSARPPGQADHRDPCPNSVPLLPPSPLPSGKTPSRIRACRYILDDGDFLCLAIEFSQPSLLPQQNVDSDPTKWPCACDKGCSWRWPLASLSCCG